MKILNTLLKIVRQYRGRVLLFFFLILPAFYFLAKLNVLTPMWFANLCGVCLLMCYAFKNWIWPVLTFFFAATWSFLFLYLPPPNLLTLSEILFFFLPYCLAVTIFKIKNQYKMLKYLKTHDQLTGLLNRRQFEKILKQKQAEIDKTNGFYILGCLDIDNLKAINESMSCQAGDNILQVVAKLLNKYMRGQYIFARLGGDEFAILGIGVSPLIYQKQTNQMIKKLYSLRFQWENKVYRISVSLGSALVRKQVNIFYQPLVSAELACRQVKKDGYNRSILVEADKQKNDENHKEALFANSINEAIEENLLLVYAQKIVSTRKEDKTQQYEVLVRMLDKNGELIPASEITPVAERFNLITKIDSWMVTQILNCYDKLNQLSANTTFCINISAISFSDPNFLSFLMTAIQKSSFPPNQLCFEITETAAMTNINLTTRFVREISKLGCKISLDDFGVGLCSFTYLQKFKVDYLKIDGNFVTRMIKHDRDKVIVDTINVMAHQLSIQTVAEYVENQVILKAVQDIGIDYAQGFIIEEPKPLRFLFNNE